MGVFGEEESANIKIGVSKECECDDSCVFIASIGGSRRGSGCGDRSGCGGRSGGRTVTGRFKSVPQGNF